MPLFKSEAIKKVNLAPLLHPPLLEAIFELRWELATDPQTRGLRDPSYPMMYGRLYERLKKDFPFVEDLPSVQTHPQAAPFVPRHRLRASNNTYPLMQIGPGIITLNDTRSYSWSAFKSLITRLIESIMELYPKDSSPLNFVKSEIRYVNGIRCDIARENPLFFMRDKLHTHIELDSDFSELVGERGPNAVALNLAYALQKPMGNLGLSLNLGQFEGKPAYILQTLIHSFGEIVPADVPTFALWLEEAHTVAEKCFHIFCKGELMETFYGSAKL